MCSEIHLPPIGAGEVSGVLSHLEGFPEAWLMSVEILTQFSQWLSEAPWIVPGLPGVGEGRMVTPVQLMAGSIRDLWKYVVSSKYQASRRRKVSSFFFSLNKSNMNFYFNIKAHFVEDK